MKLSPTETSLICGSGLNIWTCLNKSILRVAIQQSELCSLALSLLTPQPQSSRCEGSSWGRKWSSALGRSWRCLLCCTSDRPQCPSHLLTPPGFYPLETSALPRQGSVWGKKTVVRSCWYCMSKCISLVRLQGKVLVCYDGQTTVSSFSTFTRNQMKETVLPPHS